MRQRSAQTLSGHALTVGVADLSVRRRFRFEVNMNTGTETGSVYPVDHIAGPEVQCTLQGVGTGKD